MDGVALSMPIGLGLVRIGNFLNGEFGEYSRRFAVYNQKTDPEGNEVVREMTADNRTTHWVPAVQK